MVKRKGVNYGKIVRRAGASGNVQQHECHDLIVRWILRILINLNTWKSSGVENNEGILQLIGLTGESFNNLDPSKIEIFKVLKKTKEKTDRKKIKLNTTTNENLKWLQGLLGLTNVELEIFLFAVCVSNYSHLESTADELGSLSKSGVSKVLAIILNISHKEVSDALSAKGNLINSGLFKLEKGGNNCLDQMLLIPDGIHDILSVDVSERNNMLSQFFYQSNASSLKLKDYPHIKKDIKLLKQYLSVATNQKVVGVNILIYGDPGTGKTQLVGTLAKSLHKKLYQISSADTDGDNLLDSGRLEAYQMAQRILKKSQSLLLFDEIEDIFPNKYFISRPNEPGKAWFNNLLETNNVPTFWLSNDINQIDNAYIRRFDYVLELKAPPQSVRKTILQNNLGGLNVSEQWIEQMSRDKQLVPGMISRAAKMVTSISCSDEASVQDNVEQVLSNTLRAMGKRTQKLDLKSSTVDYQLDALNPSHNIGQLLEGLQNVAVARLCMYGPPGTGKTAFGHYISNTLDKPLIVRRASDILSPYVGVAEMNMAAMFEEARDEDAVLLLDEADSFLQDRSTLKQSWEVTQVNELLTQMESFEGLFVCSTNLMDKLDAAVLRRFDFKIKLDYLKAEQAWKMFCNAVGWNKKQAKKNTHWYDELSGYKNLTPGDFTNVLRQNRLSVHSLTAEVLITGLKQESTFKQDRNNSRGIGFHANF